MKPYLAPVMNGIDRSLGIMICPTDGTPPFADQRFLARLCRTGEETGLPVFIFAPEWAIPNARLVAGYRYEADHRWSKRLMPYPDLIYDRSFYSCPKRARQQREALRQMFEERPIPLLGRGVGSKLKVASVLNRYPQLRPHLPETHVYTGMNKLLSWLQQHGEAVLKPAGGMHGQGVVRIVQTADDEYRLTGRSRSNRILETRLAGSDALEAAVHDVTTGQRYLIQPYLKLTTKQGDAFDIRSLVQKDQHGRWAVTGMAVRRGPRGSLTSNLHGGGSVEPLTPFLLEQYGAEAVAQIQAELLRLSRLIPAVLERHNGRLAELGIDLGVDRKGGIWIIEVNTKPGREAFAAGTAGLLAARMAYEHPVLYARFLLGLTIRRQSGDVKPDAIRSSR